MEAERDDAVSQLLDLQDARRELQAQLSAKAAELRVSEGTVKQLEADMKQLEIDLAEACRLQRAATTGPVEMLTLPRVTQSQALATSISRMTLGSTQSPASTHAVVQHALMPAETSSVRVTGARAFAHPVDSPYTLQTVHGGCTCHQPVEYVSYGRAPAQRMPTELAGTTINTAPMYRRHRLVTTMRIYPTLLRMSQDASLNSVPCPCDGKWYDYNL